MAGIKFNAVVSIRKTFGVVDKFTAADERTDGSNNGSTFNPIINPGNFLADNQGGYDHNGAEDRMPKIGKGFQSLSQPNF